VNVRADRSRRAPVVRILQPGELVQLDLLEEGWYRVVADRGSLGYVDGRYFDTTPAATPP
jgi:hypothetical protein